MLYSNYDLTQLNFCQKGEVILQQIQRAQAAGISEPMPFPKNLATRAQRKS